MVPGPEPQNDCKSFAVDIFQIEIYQDTPKYTPLYSLLLRSQPRSGNNESSLTRILCVLDLHPRRIEFSNC